MSRQPTSNDASMPEVEGRRAIVSNWTITRIPVTNTGDLDSEDLVNSSSSSEDGQVSVTTTIPATGNTAGIPVVQRRNVLRPGTARVVSRPPPRANEDMFSTFMLPFMQQPLTAQQQVPSHMPPSNQFQQASQYLLNPTLRNKPVHVLDCRFCGQEVCVRAMKAILLADTKVELYSTDIPPNNLRLLDEDRITQGCHCRIRDTACSCW